ncbi:MAG: 2,3-bisphosphoglycerate-independent phosphoglycerate mutase [Patescibacteria group bacterium]|nr:2,3-bisphosphoglycerate-independent phosphoglycerate mutase [Patescibacteria group bacterium]
MKRQIVLAILDGWGIGKKDGSNPIHIQGTPNIDYIKSHFPAGAIQASGIAVGLPWEEEGNSEVGHLTLGAGRVIFQHYPRISMAIRDGSFFKNKVLLDLVDFVKKNNGTLNLAGLMTGANVHASLEHLLALIEFAKRNNVPKVNLHLYTDGKDSPLQSAGGLLSEIEKVLTPNIKIASIIGRYYAEDRDQHWDRTQKAYNTLTGEGPMTNDYMALIASNYKKNLSDEYIEPHLIGPENNGIKDGDGLFFFDFREDSIRQIVEPFINPDFQRFPVKKFTNLYIATMTEYSSMFNLPVAFPQQKVDNPLGKILSENGKSQLRIAETDKYAHVTVFFNGLQDKTFLNEFRILVPSKKVVKKEEAPEMMASEITSRVMQALDENSFDFILINYANGDMMGHTGNFDAGMKAVKTIDEEMRKLSQKVLENNDILIITADHGNVEKMMDPLTAMPTTGHDTSPVPVYIIANEFYRNKTAEEVEESESEVVGMLSDIAPTILKLMGIPKPPEMTGQDLLPLLR